MVDWKIKYIWTTYFHSNRQYKWTKQTIQLVFVSKNKQSFLNKSNLITLITIDRYIDISSLESKNHSLDESIQFIDWIEIEIIISFIHKHTYFQLLNRINLHKHTQRERDKTIFKSFCQWFFCVSKKKKSNDHRIEPKEKLIQFVCKNKNQKTKKKKIKAILEMRNKN